MSTQQDIYAAGSENHPPMLNKDNYVPWSSRLLRYAKSKPNGKLIYNSIINGPYVKRMIPEPGDPDREVLVAETFHEQTDDELTKKEVKQMEADDQAIQIILMGLPKDIYAVVDSYQPSSITYMQQPQPNNHFIQQPSFNTNYMQQPMPNPEDITDPTTAMNMSLVLMAKEFKLNYSTPTNNNQRISSNPHNRQIAQPGMNIGQDRQMQMVGGNGVQNDGNQNRLIVVSGIVNQNPNENGNVVAARAEGNANGNNEAVKFVRDFKSLAKEADESLAKHKTLEFKIERLLRAVVSQDIMFIVQSNSVVDTSNFQTELDRTKEKLENCIIKKEKEYVVLWNNWYTKCEECNYDKISYDKAYNDMQQKIKRLQAQLGDQKGKIKDTPCISDTLDSLS
ncbi:hypothetical protein Tco_0287623 [Tanacetum coccineum]